MKTFTTLSLSAPRFSLTSTLLLVGFISSAVAWWLIAIPVTTFSSTDKHPDHFAWVFLHVIGGTIMLFLGLANLYVGATGKHFKFHKIIGRVYLIGGALGSLAAIIVTLSTAHKAAGAGTFTNTTISLLSLAAAWLLAAGMSYRAVRNYRIDSHRDWIIRSYVLAWSFVFCRLASRVPGIEEMGGGNAFIWLSWVGPLILCEVALQWRDGGGRAKPSLKPPIGSA